MTNTITLLNLLTFTPVNEEEKKLFNFDKLYINKFIKRLDEGRFYLGGQLKMKPNDVINLDSIEQVREICRKRFIEYGGPCNSLEAASIYESDRDLEFIENMIKKYNEIMELRGNH
jgi:hypothetical protein